MENSRFVPPPGPEDRESLESVLRDPSRLDSAIKRESESIKRKAYAKLVDSGLIKINNAGDPMPTVWFTLVNFGTSLADMLISFIGNALLFSTIWYLVGLTPVGTFFTSILAQFNVNLVGTDLWKFGFITGIIGSSIISHVTCGVCRGWFKNHIENNIDRSALLY